MTEYYIKDDNRKIFKVSNGHIYYCWISWIWSRINELLPDEKIPWESSIITDIEALNIYQRCPSFEDLRENLLSFKMIEELKK